MGDRELMQNYLRDRSPEAYGAIVREHVDLVYAAARRQLGDGHLADDVTQAVFILFGRKAETIGGSLAGWLVKATHYACRDARRLAARREFHERQAMKSRPEITAPPEPQWDEYAPYLDESLARLSTDDRETLTLRYLKGLPLREVGLFQQVSEVAARKRVQRALDRLRKMMSRRTTMPAVAVLGTTLAANSAHAAPAALTSTIVAAAPASASVGLIASAAQKSLWLLKAKVAAIAAAAAVVGVTTIAATTAILYHAATPKPAVPPAQFVAASTSPQIGAADVDEKESTVPGEIQCVRWDVLLDAVELANLRKIAAPLKTSSTIYNAYAVSGVELRRAVRNAIDAGTFESASTSMGFADRSLMDNNQTYRFSAGLNFYTDTNTRNAIMITGGSNQDSDTMTRIAGNRAHLNISHPDFHVSIAQLARNTRWIDQPGQSIAYEGDLSPGQAVVFIGQLPTVAGRDFVHVIVCETFQADQEQMPVIDRQRSAQWWCENGPASLRAWANVSRVWSAKATHPYGEVAAPFEFTLEDGKIVRLAALCRPAVWPFCWWDAEGNPANENSGMLLLNGEPPEGTWAYVTVASTDPRENRRLGGQLDAPATDPQGPPSFSPLTDTFCQQIHDESAIDFGIAVGPWKQIGTLEMDIPQTIDGVTYTIRKPLAFGDKQFLIHFVQQGVVENQDELVAVDGSGKWASFSLLETAILQGHHANRQRLDRQPNFDGIALTDVKEWRLMQQWRQWKTFACNFATNPKTPPPRTRQRPLRKVIAAEQVAKREEPLRKRREMAGDSGDTRYRSRHRPIVHRRHPHARRGRSRSASHVESPERPPGHSRDCPLCGVAGHASRCGDLTVRRAGV